MAYLPGQSTYLDLKMRSEFLILVALSRLVLMTYHGVVLLLSGYQANEDKLLAEYRAIVDK